MVGPMLADEPKAAAAAAAAEAAAAAAAPPGCEDDALLAASAHFWCLYLQERSEQNQVHQFKNDLHGHFFNTLLVHHQSHSPKLGLPTKVHLLVHAPVWRHEHR